MAKKSGFTLEDFADVLPQGASSVVKACPVSKASQGVITMSPGLISQIAGAVRDKIEWIVLMNGKRSADGFEVIVDRFTVPQQYRSGGDADMLDTQMDADVVGVMHSHHKMGAFFSGIDDRTLNPRFPCSIVVAISRNNFGFDYKACGKVVLPCGATAEEVPFKLNVAGVPRFAQKAIRATHEGEVAGLGDCPNYTETDVDQYTLVEKASCGLSAIVAQSLVFGLAGGEELLEVIRAQTQKRVFNFQKGGGRQNLLGDGQHTYTTGNNSKKGKGKYGAYRNGLKKLFRPGEDPDGDERGRVLSSSSFDGPGTYQMKQCDSCRVDGQMVKKHLEFDSYLCSDCWADAEKIIAESIDLGGTGVSAFEMVKM